MVKQDYIMRLIQQMIQAILKIVLKVDTPEMALEDLEEKDTFDGYDRLCALIDAGRINEAENELSEIIDVDDHDTFQIALLFYNRLNLLDNDRLEACSFSREEVRDGLLLVLRQFGYESFADTFMSGHEMD